MNKKRIVVYVSAGGLSTRLYPLTIEVTKAWLDIGNKTPFFIALQNLLALIKNPEVYILTQGFQNDIFITSELKDGSRFSQNASIRYFRFFDETKDVEKRHITEGSGEGFINFLERFERELGDAVILSMNVDNLANFDPNDMLRYHNMFHRGRPGVTIGVTYWGDRPDINQFGTVRFDEKGKVIEFREKSPEPASLYINTGIVMFSPEVVQFLRGRSSELKDLGGHVIPFLLSNGVSVCAYGHQTEGFRQIRDWVDFGTIEAYLRANGNVLNGIYDWFEFQNYERLEGDSYSALVHKNSFETLKDVLKNGKVSLKDRSIIGSGINLIGPVSISNAVIGHNITIGNVEVSGTQEYPAVLLDASTIVNSELRSSIVGYSSCLNAKDRKSSMGEFSVIGNNITVANARIDSRVRVADSRYTELILSTNKYEIVYASNNLIFFVEKQSSYNPFR
ncbi:MAG: NDP-sugar synthase [Candidatus Aenigmarchaeota archaeon]|nr:NDP-sugar synthase [Candidatus Aenigmarchaeota archaeon]